MNIISVKKITCCLSLAMAFSAAAQAGTQQDLTDSAMPGKESEIVLDGSLFKVDLSADKFDRLGNAGTQEKFFNRFTGAFEVSAAAAQAERSNKRAGENNSLYLEVLGTVSKTHGAEWSTTFPNQLNLQEYGYFYAVVRASGLRRKQSLQPAISAIAANKMTLLNTAEIVQDGIYRTYWKKVKLDSPIQGIKFTVNTKNAHAWMEVAEIGFARDINDIPQANICVPGKFQAPFNSIPLEPDRFNWSLQENLASRIADATWAVVEPVQKFPAAVVEVAGIPFRVQANGKADLIRAANNFHKEASQTLTVLGRELTRGSYQPPSRNDAITVTVNARGSELYFLLSTDLPAASERYGMFAAPRLLNFIEAFQVNLHYDDDSIDVAFPYQLKSAGFQLSGFFGAYAVALDPSKKLRYVEFVNKIPRFDVALAAVTINSSAKRLHPELCPDLTAHNVPAENTITPDSCQITRNDDIVVLENKYYTMELDFSKGFAIKSLVNKFSGDPIVFGAGSGLLVKQDKISMLGNICKVEDLEITDNKVTFALSTSEHIPAKFLLAITIDETPQIKFDAQMTVLADKAKTELSFPYFYDLKIGELADNGYFYPQYRNMLTLENSYCSQHNHRGFTMQFFDIFNQKSGSGLLFMTDNKTQMPVWYTAGKSDSGMLGCIGNSSEELGLVADTPIELCSRSLTVHGGGWKRGAEHYRNYLKTWYKPVNAQDKEKFLNAFYIHVTASAPCDAGLWPFLIDNQSKKYDVNAYLSAIKKQFNCMPDIFHFYWWSYRPNGARNGEYGEKDFTNLIGSTENFRNLIGELKNQNMLVSLYTIWDRYDRDTEFFAKHGEDLIIKRPDGTSDKTADTIYTGVGGAHRRDYAAQALSNMVNSVNNDIVYMDVFGTDWYDRCVNPACGHKVPSWIAEDDGLFLQKLRNAMPETAFWCEYPVTDINTQYLDGNINYFALPLWEHIVPVYDRDDTAPRNGERLLVPDYGRFAFPHLKQVVFQVGQEGFIETWAYMKFNLFNGYALYDTTFWLYFNDTRNNLAKTLAIQKKYSDCFLSENPEMLVPTLVADCYANRFPGKNRTLWTFFNANFVTVEQDVIVVDHYPGAKYIDAWNNRSLTPEIQGDKAIIYLRLEPQEVGCIVQQRK